MFKKIKSKIKMPKEEKMLWLLLALPIAFLPLIYSLTPDSFYIENVFQWSTVIDYYIELLSAVGAVFLGVIAISQTQRLQSLEERADDRANSCNIYIENNNEDSVLDLFNIESYEDKDETRILSNKNKEYAGEWKYISFTMENYSNAFLKEIDIFFGDIHFNSNVTLIEHKKQKFAVNIPKSLEDNKEHICKIVFTSCYNVKTYGSFNIFMPVREYEEEMDMVDIYNYSFYGTEQPK